MEDTIGETLRKAKAELETQISTLIQDFAKKYGVKIGVDVTVVHIKDRFQGESKPRYAGRVSVLTKVSLEA